MYDITIDDQSNGESFANEFTDQTFDIANDFMPYTNSIDPKDRSNYVLIKNFYQIKEVNVYICSNEFSEIYGFVTAKKPKPIIIPNPAKLQLAQQIQQLTQQVQQLAQQSQDTSTQNQMVMQGTDYENNQDFQSSGIASQALDKQKEQISQQGQQLTEQLQQMQIVYGQMPDTIPAFKAIKDNITEDGKVIQEEQIVTKVINKKRRRVLWTLLVGNQKVNQEYISCDTIPIVPIAFSFFNNPNKVYGITHFIIDIIKAMNKYLSEIMYDVSVNGHRKGFIWEGTITDPVNLESNWSKPNALLSLRFNPAIPDGGKPFFLEPSTINQSIQYMLGYFKELIEYITGIYGVMQGNANEAPTTFGATQSIQNFGTQRIKQYARNLEQSLEKLAYVVVNYIQSYCPRDKVLKYFDEDGNGQEVTIMENSEDLKFKVRVEIINSLPTTRQMQSQTLGFIAQTTGSDQLRSLLVEEMLKTADYPEARELAKKMNVMQQMEQQMQQMQQQLQALEGQNKQLQNNMAEKDLYSEIEKKKIQAQSQIDLATQDSINQLQPDETGGQEQAIPDEYNF